MTIVYATAADLEARFGAAEMLQIAPEPELLAQALVDGSGEVEVVMNALGKRLVAPYPAFIVSITCNLARWYLYEDQVPDEVKNRADNARKLLTRLAKGEIALGASATEDLPSADRPVSSGKVMTDRPLMRW
ncbi:MAG: DUF1320 domain-containing protein [Zoogloeaceae bacterium]|jgi:phage gp36-like protein|nr:DUF1320 domain-containing protein [Zoogloeaceae bacterium]